MANEPVVKAFNKALFSIKDSKTPISKQKIIEITKAGMSALRYYKHVVLNVEKFIQKCAPAYKIPAFYIVDSIVRQGIKQHKEKDVFGPRFSINLVSTLQHSLNCPEEEKLKIVRVINLWRTHNVFAPNVIESLLSYCQSAGLDVDIQTVEKKVKGDKANMTIYYDNEIKKQKKGTPQTPPPHRNDLNGSSSASQEVAHSEAVPLNGISEKEISIRLQQTFPQWAAQIDKDTAAFQKFVDLVNEGLNQRVSREKASQGANISSILTQDFDYSDDEEEVKQKTEFQVPKEKIESFVNEIFSDDSFRAGASAIYTSLLASQRPIPVPFPNASNILTNKPPPSLVNPWFNPLTNMSSQFPNPFAPDSIPVPVESPLKSHQEDERHDSYRSRHGRKRDRGRSPDSHSSDKKRRRNSRSPLISERDKEKERRRLGLPSRLREEHTIVASRTLWFGRLPTNCTEQDIRNALKDRDLSPERINIIPARACAYVTMGQRRSAYKIIDRYRDFRVAGKSVKLEWATGAGISKNDNKIMEYWDSNRGYLSIPHKKLPKDLAGLLDGNQLDVDTLPHHLKGKFTEKGLVERSPSKEAMERASQLPSDIPLPASAQLAGLPQFPPTISSEGVTNLPGLPSLAFPGFIQPNLLAAVLSQQQAPPNFENLLSALQQNAGAGGLLPTPQSIAPNIFTNVSFDNNNPEQQGADQQQAFQSKFIRPHVNFRGDRGGNFRLRFGRGGGQNGEFRPRGRGRGGDFRGGFRGQRFPRRGNNFHNANFQPLPAFNQLTGNATQLLGNNMEASARQFNQPLSDVPNTGMPSQQLLTEDSPTVEMEIEEPFLS